MNLHIDSEENKIPPYKQKREAKPLHHKALKIILWIILLFELLYFFAHLTGPVTKSKFRMPTMQLQKINLAIKKSLEKEVDQAIDILRTVKVKNGIILKNVIQKWTHLKLIRQKTVLSKPESKLKTLSKKTLKTRPLTPIIVSEENSTKKISPIQHHVPITMKTIAHLPLITFSEETNTRLSNLKTNVLGNITTLSFVFDKPLYKYSLSHSVDENKLTILLDDTVMTGEVAIPRATSGYKIELFPEEDSVTIAIDLDKETQIQKLDLIEQPLPELQLALYNPNTQINIKAEEQNLMLREVAGRLHIVPSHPNREKQADELYQKALLFLSSNPNYAEIKLAEIVKRYKENIPARETLAMILINSGRNRSALKILNEGLRYQPTYVPFIKLKAVILSKQKNNLKQAIKLLETNAPADLEENPDYFAFLAALYLKRKDYYLATPLYYRLVHLPDVKGSWWLGLATSLDESGNHNAAKDAYREAYRSGDLSDSVLLFIQNKLK